LRILRDYYWPGNVRELENLMQYLVVMSDDKVIDSPDLPSHMRYSVSEGADINKTIEEVEAQHIYNVLSHVKGNKTHAASILGIDRKTLREKLRKHKIEEIFR
jgi:DNA-binding NtrC family response regulator